MDVSQQVVLNLGKRLVPQELRPAQAEEWGAPLLNSSQFIIGLSVMTLSIVSGIFLYYSFYITFILASVETFEKPPPNAPNSRRVAGSYHRTIRHVISTIGVWGFFTGMMTFMVTGLLGFIGRRVILKYAGLPGNAVDSSVLAVVGGLETVSAFFLEPLSILFTHKILTASGFSFLGSLIRLLRSTDFYLSLVYIGSIRAIIYAIQNSLLITDRSQHYSRPYTTASIYLGFLLLRVFLVARTHAILLPPTAVTVVEIRQPKHELGVRVQKTLVRGLWMIKLLLVCGIITAVHVIASVTGLIYASGYSNLIFTWIWGKIQGKPGVPTSPEPMMDYDPEMDPYHHH